MSNFQWSYYHLKQVYRAVPDSPRGIWFLRGDRCLGPPIGESITEWDSDDLQFYRLLDEPLIDRLLIVRMGIDLTLEAAARQSGRHWELLRSPG